MIKSKIMHKLVAFIILLLLPIIGTSQSVKLTEEVWHGTGCYKIEMSIGTVYFEKDNGVSGFKSFIDPDGNDWIASYLEPGPNGNFRGFPNSVGNFGHAGRDSGSKTIIVNGKKEGEVVILESSNNQFTFQYWFFTDRIAIKVLKSEGEYCFLLECVAGGTSDAEDFFVTADGKKHIPTQDGEFDDFTPEWFYIGDPKSNYYLFLGKTPDDKAPNENHRQIRPGNLHNMDLYSFGRTGQEHKYKIEGMSGNEHVCIIGFHRADRPHNQIAATIESFLESPFTAGVRARSIWGNHLLKKDKAWFASEDAIKIANSIIQYQSPQGGWPKSTDLGRPPLTEGDIPQEGRGRANSLDNDATTVPIEFLARVIQATNDDKFKTSLYRGLDYLFAAQFPNGGWPQFWPLRGDKYYSRITYNDGAMIRVMNILKDIVDRKEQYAFINKEYREKAKVAMDLGIKCILKSQIREEGELKVWCAQHNEKTLEPAWARAYEPPSFSGSESVDIIRFLMSLDNPSPEIIAAVEGGVKWLKSVAITGIRMDKRLNPDGRTEPILIPDSNAPLLWARFYELRTNRPLYLDRDSKFRYDFSEIGYERRSGYAYHGYWANDLLETEYPIWKSKYDKTIYSIDPKFVVEAEEGTFTGIIDRHSCWHNIMLSDAPHSTHSGRGLVDTKNEIGSFIEVSYNALWSGSHRITVRYTHIKDDPRPGKLIINGKEVATISMKQTEALPAYKTESINVNLKEGINVIRLSAINDGGLPNMDYIKVAEVRKDHSGILPRIQILEAEDGTFLGKEDHHSCWNYIAQNNDAHSGFTGEGYIDTYNKVGSYIEVEWDAPREGNYELGIRYVHGKSDIRPAKIEVNGEVISSLAFISTGSWTAWTTNTIPVFLKKGMNTVKISAEGTQGLTNIDHFSFTLFKD